MKVAVVGGGVIGLTVAYELRRRGAEVVLLERGAVGSGASGAAGGILSPLHPWECSVPTLRLLTLSRQRWQSLFAALHRAGQAAAPINSGILYTDANSIGAVRRWADEHGWEGRLLGRAELQRTVSGLVASEGFLLADVQQIVSRELLEGLSNLLRAEGVRIAENCSVNELTIRQQKVCGVVSADGDIETECVVLCAGAWTSQLCPDLPPNCIRPIRGQMIEIESMHAALTALPHIIVSDGHYLIPRSNGRIIVGSTLEDCGFDHTVTRQARQELFGFARDLIPSLKDSAVTAQWAGLRPAPAGAEPLMGCHPALAGLFISAGHFRNGIALAPGSAQQIAAMVVGDTPRSEIDLLTGNQPD